MVSRPAVARSATGHPAALGSTSVSGPGQNASASRAARRRNSRQRPRRREIGDVRDQRIESRPALGGIEPRHRLAIAGVGAEPVNRLGRKGDEPAGRKNARRFARSRQRRRAERASPAWVTGPVIAEPWCLNELGTVQACPTSGARDMPGSGLPGRNADCYKPPRLALANVGVWLSLVEHLVRDEGVAGSNPATPTSLRSASFSPASHLAAR